MLVSHSASIMDWLRVTVACSHLGVDPRVRCGRRPVARRQPASPALRALPQKMGKRRHFGLVATLAIRPFVGSLDEELSNRGGVHGPHHEERGS